MTETVSGQHRTVVAGGTPVAGLLASLGTSFARLLRQEVALARSELSEKLGQMAAGVGLVTAAGILGFSGLLYLLGSATIALSKVVDAWIAALAIGVVVMIVGGFLGWLGTSRLKSGNLAPLRTARSIQDDAAWAKERLH
jgi:hypothetical protein